MRRSDNEHCSSFVTLCSQTPEVPFKTTELHTKPSSEVSRGHANAKFSLAVNTVFKVEVGSKLLKRQKFSFAIKF